MSNENEITEIINNYFVDVIETLDIEPYIKDNYLTNYSSNNLANIITKYEQHPSILKIKEFVNISENFTIIKTSKQHLQPQILALNPHKASAENDIPTKLLIETNEIIAKYLTKIYHNSIENRIFPDSLKQAEVIPTNKKDEKTKKRKLSPCKLTT